MARGANSKLSVANKILETFNGAFLYNDGKEIRIPMSEDGEVIQIKVALTAAKENVNPGDDNATPGAAADKVTFVETTSKEVETVIQPTAEEKQNVADLLKALGL